jgi:hypothetical protein
MLCGTCERIDFRKYIDVPMRHEVALGQLREIRRKSDGCSFCSLVCFAIQKVSTTQKASTTVSVQNRIWLTNQMSWKRSIVFAPYDGERIERYSTTKEVTADAQARAGNTAYRFVLLNREGAEVGEIQHIPTPGFAIVPLASGRRVHQDNADIELIRRWLTQCHRVHGVFCEESGKAARTLPHIRVIDVQTNLIIEAPNPCRFIALSYVWGGKSNFALLNRKDLLLDDRGSPFAHLPQKLPQTIGDAIHLCRLLEERYIWVDSLCIVQDSAEDKKTQMEHMDAIYNSAFVTILAASGTGADDGLAGISRSRPKAQKVRLVKGSQYAVPLPAYMDVLSDSSIAWNTRGWTFQEKVLSKRMLVFTDCQVYFQCSNMVWYEDAAMETEGSQDKATINWRPLRWAADRTPHSPQDGLELGTVAGEYLLGKLSERLNRGRNTSLVNTLGMIGMVLGKGIFRKNDTLRAGKYSLNGFANDKHFGQVALVALNRIKFATYILAIQEYKGRNLTNQADGVNAIQGVLKTLSEQWGAFHSGLPESHLASALLWGPPTHGAIRQYSIEEAPFPSWSWARWSFPQGIAWQTPKPSWAKLGSRAYLVKPSAVTELTSASSDPEPLYNEQPPVINYRSLSPQARRHLDIIGELLCMNCVIIRVQIGGIWKGSSDAAEGTIKEYYLKLQNGDIVGHIRMSTEERGCCGERVQEFVTVCWETGYDGPSIPSHLIPTKTISTGTEENPRTETVNMSPREYPTASVFLVRWKNEIAERVALGHIVGKPWESCDRERRWTLLG